MANLFGQTNLDLSDSIREQPESYSLFQLLRNLEREKGYDYKELPVWIRPKLTLGTAHSEVTSLEETSEDSTLQVETTKPALYGAKSPLPKFYTEDLIAAELDETTVGRLLLDSIHNRLYRLDDEAYRKYNIPFNQVERNNDVFSQLLQSLIGFKEYSQNEDALNVLKYQSVLGRKQRSAEGLRVILEDQLPNSDIEINQCTTRNIRLEQTERITLGGKGNSIGENTILGEWVVDTNGKFEIHIKDKDVAKKAKKHWFNQPAKRESLINWIRLYLNTPVECDLIIELDSSDVESPSLGEEGGWVALGKTTWLVGQEKDLPVFARIKVQ